MKNRDLAIMLAWNNLDVPAEETALRFGYNSLKSLCAYVTRQRYKGFGANYIYRVWGRSAA